MCFLLTKSQSHVDELVLRGDDRGALGIPAIPAGKQPFSKVPHILRKLVVEKLHEEHVDARAWGLCGGCMRPPLLCDRL